MGLTATDEPPSMTAVKMDRNDDNKTNDAASTTENGSFSDSSVATTNSNSPLVDAVDSDNKNNNNNGDDDADDDLQLIALAESAYKDEKLFEAERLLDRVQDTTLLTEYHSTIIDLAREARDVLSDLICCIVPSSENNDDDDDNTGGWIKQGDSYGKYNTNVYYKHPEGYMSSMITCRVETPIPTDMLIPLLSVLNETDLYQSWVPDWPALRLGLRLSQQLKSVNRVNQVICLYGNAPWPFTPRQMIARTTAVDEVDADDANYYLAVTLHNNTDETIVLPEETKGAVTCDVEGAFLFRPCPLDHPLLLAGSDDDDEDNEPINNNTNDEDWEPIQDSADEQQQQEPSSTRKDVNNNNNSTSTDGLPTPARQPIDQNDKAGDGEPKILVSFKLALNPHMRGVPQSIVNFILRQAIGGVWYFLIMVAEEIRDGKRPLHTEAMKNKPEIYQFIQERADRMINRMKAEQAAAAEEKAAV